MREGWGESKNDMNYIKNKFLFGLGGIISLAALGTFIYFVSPEQELIPAIPIRPIIILFVLICLTVFLLGTFFFKNLRRGILLGLFITTATALWFFGFRDVLYFGLILLIVLLVEGFFFHPKRSHPDSKEI